MKAYNVVRSTLGEWNRGICGSRSNCRYNGASPAWVVTQSDVERGEVALKTKAQAQYVAQCANDIGHNGVGDIVAITSDWLASKGLRHVELKEV